MNKPFLLKPSGKDYLWGGERLNSEFDKGIDLKPLAETWECSTHPDGPSFVASGDNKGKSLADVLQKHPEYLGSRHKGEEALSILIKLIDSKKELSIQVHPDDAFARKYENGQLGKTEMWYVLDAAEDAKLVYGLRQNCSKEDIRSAITTGELGKYLQVIPVRKDDVFFIKPGTIHAIGAGCLIAEIQESSNLTYRLYDYDRVGNDGRKRELHIERALRVANLKSSAEPRQPMRVLKYRPGYAGELLGRCKYFEVYRMLINTDPEGVYCRADRFSYRALLCVEGSGDLSFEGETLEFGKGDCIFIPADSVDIRICGKAQLLNVKG